MAFRTRINATPAVVGTPANWQITANMAQRDPSTSPGSTFDYAWVDVGRAASTGFDITASVASIGTGTEANIGIVLTAGRAAAQLVPAGTARWIYSDAFGDHQFTVATWTAWVTPFPMLVNVRYALDGAGVLKVTFTAASGETASGSTPVSGSGVTLYDPQTVIGLIGMSTSTYDYFGFTDRSVFDSFNRANQPGLGVTDTGQVWQFYP